MTDSPHPSLDAIFSKDPLSLTKTDLEELVDYYRRTRETFLLEESLPKKPRATKKKPSPLDLDSLKNLKLDL